MGRVTPEVKDRDAEGEWVEPFLCLPALEMPQKRMNLSLTKAQTTRVRSPGWEETVWSFQMAAALLPGFHEAGGSSCSLVERKLQLHVWHLFFFPNHDQKPLPHLAHLEDPVRQGVLRTQYAPLTV